MSLICFQFVAKRKRHLQRSPFSPYKNRKKGRSSDKCRAVLRKLFLSFYQSDKYTAKTAVSEKVTVTLQKEKTFDVTQNSTTQLTLNFSTAVEALATSDVSVIRTFGTYEYPQVVKSVTLAKDGMSATVVVFNKFTNGTNYTIKVKEFEDSTMTASVGRPVRMELVAKDREPAIVLITDTATKILYKLYDAAGVEVTDTVTEPVTIQLQSTATYNDYFLAGDMLTIRKNTASPVLVGKYPGWIEEGKRVGAFDSEPTAFFAVDAEVVLPVGIRDYTLSPEPYFDGNVKTMQIKDTNKKLAIKINRSNGQWDDTTYTYGTPYEGYDFYTESRITFTAMNPDICTISTVTGLLTAYKPGTANFYANLQYYDSNRKLQETPFAVVSVEIKANSDIRSIGINKSSITVGTHAGFDTDETAYLSAYDQYGDVYGLNEADKAHFTLECTSYGYGKNDFANAVTLDGLTYVWPGNRLKIKVDAAEVVSILGDKAPAAGSSVTLYFRATYENKNVKDATEFAVIIRKPGDAKDNYRAFEVSDASKDVLRQYSSWDGNLKAAKSITFKAFLMNNGVKVATVPLKDIADYQQATAIEGEYYVKVQKNGYDINNKAFSYHDAYTVEGNVVTVNPSYVVPFKDIDTRISSSVVSGGAVSYDGLGAGTYMLVVYKVQKDKTITAVDSQSIIVTVGNAGTYALAGNQRFGSVKLQSNTTDVPYNTTDAEAILKCYTINTRENQSVLDWNGNVRNDLSFSKYFVNYSAPKGSKTVYVEEIVFYEEVAAGEYVPYVVKIQDTLYIEE